MSSSVILNGGSFAIGPAVEGQNRSRHDRRHRHAVDYEVDDEWQPEDLVATVQFLATLDDRLPAYVLPAAVSGSDVDYCHVRRDAVPRRDADVAEPVFVVDADDVSQTDGTAMPEEASADSCPAPVADVAAVEHNSSAAQTPCSSEERSIIRATNKPAHLKRVSFGSAKGSMVETRIYEKPGGDEEEPSAWTRTKSRSAARSTGSSLPADAAAAVPEETAPLLSGTEATRLASKVRVTYFESKRPLTLPSPEASDAEWDDTMAEPAPHQQQQQQQQQQHQPGYGRQTSTESGQDNPFRPDGDLSREADELVELLKGGRPISEVLKSQEHQHSPQEREQHEDESDPATAAAEQPAEATESTPLTSAGSPVTGSPVKAGGGDATDSRINNGTFGEAQDRKAASPGGVEGVVEVQRVVAAAPAESTAEHVVIKKKSKCNCCVLQ